LEDEEDVTDWLLLASDEVEDDEDGSPCSLSDVVEGVVVAFAAAAAAWRDLLDRSFLASMRRFSFSFLS